MCDTPEHYQVYQVLILYSRNMIDKDEARVMLSNIGVKLNNLDAFTPDKQEALRSILEKPEPKRKRIQPPIPEEHQSGTDLS